MRIISEDKITLTQTFYGFDETLGKKEFAVEGVRVEVKNGDRVIYERYMDGGLYGKETQGTHPIDCFLRYTLLLNEETESRCQAGDNAGNGFNSIRHRWFKAVYFKKQFFKILLDKLFLGGKPAVK